MPQLISLVVKEDLTCSRIRSAGKLQPAVPYASGIIRKIYPIRQNLQLAFIRLA